VTILVFGGNGQLGRELAAQAAARRLPLVSVDRRQADIADAAAVCAAIEAARPTFIVNAAAYNQVDRAESEPAAAERTNATGPAILAAAAEAHDIPLVHVSTDYVFDGASVRAWREDDPIHPLGVYGRSKAAGEEAVRQASAHHFILRTAWLFGAHGANFVKTILALAAERDTLDMVADKRGSPTATADLAHAIFLTEAASRTGSAVWGTYHVAGEGTASRYEQAVAVVEAQAAITGRRPTVRPVASDAFPTAAVRPAYSELDSAKFEATFGFRPAPWRVAVARTVSKILAGEAAA
jgi:dTDP-4-dehydrorhamnose reductase